MREDSHAKVTHPLFMPFDPVRALRASKIRIGKVRLQGVPAILFGVATVVAVATLGRTLSIAAPMLPEVLRETKSLLEATRRDPRPLQP